MSWEVSSRQARFLNISAVHLPLKFHLVWGQKDLLWEKQDKSPSVPFVLGARGK